MRASDFFLLGAYTPGAFVTRSNDGTCKMRRLELDEMTGVFERDFSRACVLMRGRGVRHARLEARGKSGMEK